MKFLKPEIFYPDNYYLADNATEMNFVREQYLKYLNENKGKINKRLFDLYNKHDQFHDFHLTDFSYSVDSYKYKNGGDSITLRAEFDAIEYVFTFYDVVKLNFIADNSSNGYFKMFGLEDIILCEIGFEDGYQFFNFYTSSGSLVDISFKKVKCTKRPLQINYFNRL